MPLLLLVAIRIRTRSRISQFAIRLAHKKVTHKVGQKEKKERKAQKKKENRKIEKLLAAIALKLAADAVCNVWHSHSHSPRQHGIPFGCCRN